MASYTAKELERESGFDRRTIAYYVQEGLLPKVGRRGPRTRYPKLVLDRLRFIRRVRAAEEEGAIAPVTLSDIRDLFARIRPSLVARVADGRIAVTDDLVSAPSTAFRMPPPSFRLLDSSAYARAQGRDRRSIVRRRAAEAVGEGDPGEAFLLREPVEEEAVAKEEEGSVAPDLVADADLSVEEAPGNEAEVEECATPPPPGVREGPMAPPEETTHRTVKALPGRGADDERRYRSRHYVRMAGVGESRPPDSAPEAGSPEARFRRELARHAADLLAELEAVARHRNEEGESAVESWARIRISPHIAVSVRGLGDRDEALVEAVRAVLRRVVVTGW